MAVSMEGRKLRRLLRQMMRNIEESEMGNLRALRLLRELTRCVETGSELFGCSSISRGSCSLQALLQHGPRLRGLSGKRICFSQIQVDLNLARIQPERVLV